MTTFTTHTFGLPEIVLLFAVLQTLLLTVVLLATPGRTTASNGFLCAFLLSLALSLIEVVLVKGGVTLQHPHLLGISLPTYFLLAPLYFLYVRVLTGHRLRPADTLHALPLLAGMLLVAPAYLWPGERKLDLLAQMTGDGFTQFPLLPVALISAISFQMIAYFYATYDFLEKHDAALREQASSASVLALAWLRRLSIGFCFFVVLFYLAAAELFFFYQHRLALFSPGLFSFGIAVFIFWVSWQVFRQPELFALYTPGSLPRPEQSDARTDVRKYEKTLLPAHQLQAYERRLTDFMARDKPYLDGELRLSQLAEQLGVPAHHLSQVINVTRRQTFFDFINQHRVDHARALLRRSDGPINVLEIALDSGFNSKASFNRVFKKVTGLTPSAYREQEQNGQVRTYLTR